MKLKITNIIGPMQVPEHLFDGDSEISIGRDAQSCQVTYPSEFTTVGRKHLVIQEDAGRFEVRVNTKNPVFIDGVLAVDDMELPDSCVIALGAKDGPSFSVDYVDDLQMPKTLTYAHSDEIHTKVKNSSHLMSFAIAFVVLLGGGFGYKAWQTNQQIEQMNQQAGSAIEQIYQAIDADIGEMANKLSNSVYLVVLKSKAGESPMGTAWVASDNSLATNSHVAQIFKDMPKDGSQQFIVRSIVEPHQDHVIESVAMHPAYAEFSKAWKDAAPKTISASGNMSAVDFIPGYDVALLYPKSVEGLAAPLPLASNKTLQNLTSGMEVAYVGFPMEGVQMQVFAQPTPTIQVANITSITDFFRSQSPFGLAQLIQHSLPAIGGASGSPIINARGEVIALLNAGNVVGISREGYRIPNAVQINYAQRVDLLRPLLADGEGFLIDDLKAKWHLGFDKYTSRDKAEEIAYQSIFEKVLAGWQRHFNIEKTVHLSTQDVIIKASQVINGVPATMVDFITPASGNVLVLAVGERKSDTDIMVGTFEDGEFKELSRDTRRRPFAAVNVKVDADTKIGVYVISSRLGKTGNDATSTVKLRIYHE